VITLKDYLETTCLCTQRAVAQVLPHDDLAPIFAAIGADGQTRVINPKSIRLDTAAAKHETLLAFRSFLQEIHAKRYAIILACWIVKVSPDETERASREGTGGFLKDRRVEGYEIVVGDQSGTLLASFQTVRDPEGRIAELIRLPDPQPGMYHGRFIDLLKGVNASVH
jgi:hypothetical protein